MKLNEILKESYSFGEMQKHVYDFVIAKMKLKGSLKDHALELAKSTDDFWVNEFDDVHNSISKEHERGEVFDMLANAIQAVSSSIVDYYGDEMNHPPGYKPHNLTEIDDVSDKELSKLVKLIAPEYTAKIEKIEHEKVIAKKEASAKAKEHAKENFDSVVKFVKKYDKTGWETALHHVKQMLKSRNVDEELKISFGYDSDLEKIKAAKTVQELKSCFVTARDYVAVVSDNIFNLTIPNEEKIYMSDLSTIASDDALSKKLFALIK